jgi:hypothetical protein
LTLTTTRLSGSSAEPPFVSENYRSSRGKKIGRNPKLFFVMGLAKPLKLAPLQPWPGKEYFDSYYLITKKLSISII